MRRAQQSSHGEWITVPEGATLTTVSGLSTIELVRPFGLPDFAVLTQGQACDDS